MEKKAQTGNPTSVMNFADAPRAAGPSREARAATERFLAVAEKNRYYHHLTYGAVRIFALGGDGEQAARWLQETIRWGYPCYPLFADDHMLDPVRKSPEFQRVLTALREEWEQYRQELDAAPEAMGEVFRARDRKFNRDVALKVLPDSFTVDPDRLARFRREARSSPP